MPGFDGTGPLGLGPGTGWGRGPCGAGMGWRRGYGLRKYPRYPLSKNEELEILKKEADFLEDELERVRKKIEEIEKEK